MKRTTIAAALFSLVLASGISGCSGGNSGIGVLPQTTRQATTTDLTGTWEANVLSTGGADRWERGTLEIASDKTMTQSLVSSDGTSTTSAGSIDASRDGVVTMSSAATLTGSLDAGSTLIHGVSRDGSGPESLYTAVRKAAAYSAADLAGTWKAHLLVTGSTTPLWSRSTLSIDSNGTFTALTVDMNGTAGLMPAEGALSLSGDGAVTLASDSSLEGAMDAHKSLVIWTTTPEAGGAGLAVLARQPAGCSQADLTGTWRFSSLSTGEAPSIASGTVTVSADGTATIQYANGSGSGSYQRRFILSPDGSVSVHDAEGALLTDVQGVLDAGRSTMVFTETLRFSGVALGADITIFTKQ